MRKRYFAIALGAALVVAVLVLLSGPARFGPSEPSAEASLLREVKKLLASDAEPVHWFGLSVSVSGDTAVAGASNAHAAYVFERHHGGAKNWGQLRKLTASDAQWADRFGISVAVSGDTAVVGASWQDIGGSLAGAAYVFGRDEGGADNWGEVKKLIASDAQARDQFGISVAVSGDTAVVGAYQEDAGGDNAGAAYVYGRDQGGAGNWGEVKKLTTSDAQAADWFGLGVGVSGDTVVVGADHEDAGGSSANFGATYVFQRDQGGADNWGEVKKLTASDAQVGDLFGRGVAVSGDTAVVGAYHENAGGGGNANFGAAYVFQRNEGGVDNWGEMTKLTASDAEAGDQFGIGVAVSGDTAVVGAAWEDAGGTSAGAAYVFDLLQPKPTPTPKKQPDPGDTDGDGCSDEQENGPNEFLGGRRDYLDFWDFMDVPTGTTLVRDKAIVIQDISAVVARFGAQDTGPGTFDRYSDPLSTPNQVSGDLRENYHPAYDRGAPSGPYIWNREPPDGAIVIQDIQATVGQFGHRCL